MNNNFLTNMGSFPSIGAGEFLTGNLAGPFSKGAESLAGMTGEFTSLLDLISDIGVADGQSGDLETLVQGQLEKLSLEESLKQGQDLGLGAEGSAFLLTSLSAKPAELSTDQIVVNPSSVHQAKSEAGSEMILSVSAVPQGTQAQAKDATSLESLRAWTIPLLNGDLKDVRVQAPTLNDGQVLVEHQKAKPALSQDLLAVPVATPLRQKLSVDPAVSQASLTLIEKPTLSEPKQEGVFEDFLQTKPLAESAPSTVSAVQKRDTSFGDSSFANDQGPSLDHKSQRSVKDGAEVSSMSGADFLMRGMEMKTENASESLSSDVLRLPEFLARPGDRRISADAVSFVSRKVDELKAIGGGQLTIKLDPVDLGEIRIDVKRGESGTQVTLTATRPETLALFTQSSSDLQKKLSDQGAVLEVKGVEGLAKSEPIANLAKGSGAKPAVEASQEFLSSRDVKMTSLVEGRNNVSTLDVRPSFDSGRVVTSNVTGRVESAISSLESSSSAQKHESFSGFDSSAKREDARQRWREQFDHRESA